jgi:hypothetical protein
MNEVAMDMAHMSGIIQSIYFFCMFKTNVHAFGMPCSFVIFIFIIEYAVRSTNAFSAIACLFLGHSLLGIL